MEWKGAEGRGIREWEWVVQKVRRSSEGEKVVLFSVLIKNKFTDDSDYEEGENVR